MTTPAAPAAPTAVSPSAGAAPAAAPSTPAATPGAASGGTPPAAATPAQRVAWKRAEVMQALEAAGDGDEVDVYPLIKGYKHRAKVDGKETDIPFDEMVRHAGLARAARQEITKVREAEARHKGERAALEQIAARMLDPRAAEPILVKNWGGEEAVEAWARDFLARRDQYKALTPEQRDRMDRVSRQQREAAERERSLAAREAKIKADEQRAAKAKRDSYVARAGREWPAAFTALGLPAEPRLVKEALSTTMRLLDNAHRNRVPMTVAEAQREAVEGVMARARAIYGGLPPEMLRSLVGEEGLAKIGQANIERVANQPGRSVPGNQPPREANGQFGSPRKVRMSDFD